MLARFEEKCYFYQTEGLGSEKMILGGQQNELVRVLQETQNKL